MDHWGPELPVLRGGINDNEFLKKTGRSMGFIEFVMTDPDANAERFLRGNSFPAYLPAWQDQRLLGIQPYFQESMGKLLLIGG